MRILLLALVTVCFGSALLAQDPHFSQYNASPLTLNPALTGKLDCSYRGVINYRNQWNRIPAPFVTFSAGVDAEAFKRQLGGNSLGLGFLILNDVAGDGDLSKLDLNLSVAYHQRIGKNSILSAGFQGSFVQRGVDFTKLLFPSQIGPGGVNGNPNGENLLNKDTYFDVQGGLHFSSIANANLSYNVGVAMFHILTPNESFEDDQDNELDSRIVVHGGASYAFGERWAISPSILFMKQSSAQEINFGATAGYFLESSSVYFGAYNRFGDALNVLVGLGVSDLLFGISYDFSISDISAANNNLGGFELSIAYNGCVEAKRRITHCPRF